jgi:hypothetical protein
LFLAQTEEQLFTTPVVPARSLPTILASLEHAVTTEVIFTPKSPTTITWQLNEWLGAF